MTKAEATKIQNGLKRAWLLGRKDRLRGGGCGCWPLKYTEAQIEAYYAGYYEKTECPK